MTTSTPKSDALDRSLTVNETLARFPETLGVFNQFGIDTCCGGGAALDEAAHRDGIELEALLAALRAAVEAQ